MIDATNQLFECIIWPYLIVIVLGGYALSKAFENVKIKGFKIGNNLLVLFWSIPATAVFIGLSHLDGNKLTGDLVCYFQTFIFANTFWAYIAKYIAQILENKFGGNQ